MKNIFLNLIPGISLSLTLGFGCAQDRSANDFKKQQAQEQLAKITAPVGRYSGVLTDSNGNPLGAIQISLVAKLVAQNSSDGSSGTAAPSLVGYIDYLNETSPVSFVTDTSNFDETTGNYTAKILISVNNNGATNTQTINLSTRIHNGVMSGGTIQSATSSSHILNFNLVKNGAPLSEVAAKVHDKASSADPAANQVSSYLGTTNFKASGSSKPVHLLILKPRKGTAEDFLNLVIPIKAVTVSLNYGGAAQIIHTNSSLDLRANSLTGTGSLNLSPGAGSSTTQNTVSLNLDCHFENQNKKIRCSHYANSGTGLVAESIADMDSQNSPDPVDTSTGRAAVRKIYHAYRSQESLDPKTGIVSRKRVSEKTMNGFSSSAIDLLVSYPARTVSQEIVDLFVAPSEQNVLVTIINFADDPESSVSIPIQNVAWNQKSATLNGSDKIVISSVGQANLSLDCTNFKSNPWVESKEPFSCDYTSNQGGVSIHFTGGLGLLRVRP